MSIFNAQVNASANDAEETESGNVNITAKKTLLKGAKSGANPKAWAARFTNVTVPAKATIVDAKIEIWTPTASQTMEMGVYCGKEENTGVFVAGTKTNNLTTRTTTKESVMWTITSSAVGWNVSTNFKFGMQELVNLAGWVSGNAMLVMLKPGKESQELAIENWDGTEAKAAKLIVEYTEPTISNPQSMIL